MQYNKSKLELLCIIGLSISLLFSSAVQSFAAVIPDTLNLHDENAEVKSIDLVIDKDETGKVIESDTHFIDKTGDINTIIPKDGSSFISMANEDGTSMGISLPNELNVKIGSVADNGMIVYKGNQGVDVFVQSITNKQEGIVIDGMREVLFIKDEYAPKSYTFRFDLPKGYKLLNAEDYYRKDNKVKSEHTGSVYILDDKNEIASVIDSPWAQDAVGERVETEYTIVDNMLIQHIEFDKDSTFPIMADSTNHPTKYKTLTLIAKRSEKEKLGRLLDECIEKASASNGGLFGTLLEAAGLFNFAIGFASAVYSGAVESNRSFLQNKQTVYTKAYRALTREKKPASKIGIYEKCRGVWQGGRKSAYYWKSLSISWKEL